MIYFDKSKNLLEEDKYHYQLQDVPEPELFRDIYPYDEIPKVVFNYRHVPMDMPAEIWITDTTFRDGQQSTSPFTVQQIVDLFKLMSRLGGPKGIVRQSEFFLYSEKDRAALKACQDLGLKFPEITTWIRANEKDFELVKQAGVAETGILVSCSDYHIFKKMNLTRAQAMDKYLGIVKSALAHGIKPRCHFEDLTRADFYGFVVPFANELMKLSRESGIPIKIRMCDTMGFGVNYPGTSVPRSVQGLVYGLHHHAEVPSELLEWHGHNDFYKVVTNATTAWLYGASKRWRSNTHLCAARPTAWIFPPSPTSRAILKRNSVTSFRRRRRLSGARSTRRARASMRTVCSKIPKFTTFSIPKRS